MINHPNRKKRIDRVTLRDGAIKRWFGDLEVVEAKRDLHLQPASEDIECAEKGNPSECVFSKACQRMYGSRVVLFFGTVAYIDLLDDDGVHRVHRFLLNRNAMAVISAVDSGKEVTPAGFTLHAPSQSQTIDGKSRRSRQRNAAIRDGKRPRLLEGRKEGGPRKIHSPKNLRVSFFRNGSGRVNFTEPKL